jgi:hypothetical protein
MNNKRKRKEKREMAEIIEYPHEEKMKLGIQFILHHDQHHFLTLPNTSTLEKFLPLYIWIYDMRIFIETICIRVHLCLSQHCSQ